jgi:hypothetical protein
MEFPADLRPEEVFRRLYKRQFPEAEPAPEVLGAFHEMEETASQDPEEAAAPVPGPDPARREGEAP